MIHRLPIPTPFRVGRVNCYLIDDDPLTLVDVGPNSGASLVALETALREHGRRIEDLERIVITHQHTDHLGLVGVLAERSGAEVCALDVLAPVVEDFDAYAERNDELAQALMLRHGIAPDMVTVLARDVARLPRLGRQRARRPGGCADGGELEFAGRTFRCCTAPATRPRTRCSSTLRAATLIGRRPPDQDISSNPLIAPPLGGRSGEPGGDARVR